MDLFTTLLCIFPKTEQNPRHYKVIWTKSNKMFIVKLTYFIGSQAPKRNWKKKEKKIARSLFMCSSEMPTFETENHQRPFLWFCSKLLYLVIAIDSSLIWSVSLCEIWELASPQIASCTLKPIIVFLCWNELSIVIMIRNKK